MLIFYKQQQDKLWAIWKVTLYQETITKVGEKPAPL